MPHKSFLEEVVDDSEPEREELRQKKRVERTKLRAPPSPPQASHLEIIELTDDEASFGTRKSVPSFSVIEISDDDISGGNGIKSAITSDTRATSTSPPPISHANLSGPALPLSTPVLVATDLSPAITGPKKYLFQESILNHSSIFDDSRGNENSEPIPDDTPLDSPAKAGAKKYTFQNSLLNHSSIFDDSMPDDDKEGPNLSLGRFAFKDKRATSSIPKPAMNVSRQMHSSSSSSSSSSALIEPPKPTAGKKPARVATHRFADDFSDDELAKLLKCVSCDTRWTTRKSATQKMKHVQTCAKKRSLTDETVRVLLRREIASAPVVEAVSKGKGKGKAKASSEAPTEPPTAETFFTDIIQDAAPKKRTKRLQITETLKDLGDTREDILAKAKAVLGRQNMVTDENSALPSAVDERSLPLTQPFRQSSLGQTRQSKPTMFYGSPAATDDENSDLEDYEPPRTQAFAPSKLGGRDRLGQSSRTGLSWGVTESTPGSPVLARSDSINRSVIESKSPNNELSLASPLPISMRLSSKGRSPIPQSRMTQKVTDPLHTHPIPRTPISAEGSSSWEQPPPDSGYDHDAHDGFMWNDGGIYLHYDPACDNETIAGPNDLQHAPDTSSPLNTLKAPKPRKKTLIHDSEHVLLEKNTPKKTPKRKGKEKATETVEDEDDEAWEQALKEKILQDTILHHRILRYEPILFDEFLGLITDPGSHISGRLKLQVRSFLDKQAINFYGAEPTGRRR